MSRGNKERVRMIKADDETITQLASSGVGKVLRGNPRLSLKDRIRALALYFEKIHYGRAYPDDMRETLVKGLLDYAKENDIPMEKLLATVLKNCDLVGLKQTFYTSDMPVPKVLNDNEERFKIRPFWMVKKKGGPH